MLQIRRLGYALGAEITGVNLKERQDDEAIAKIRKAFLDYNVLCFPNQDLEPAEQAAFCSRFGTLDDNRTIPQHRDPDHPSIFVTVNKPVSVKGKEFPGIKAE